MLTCFCPDVKFSLRFERWSHFRLTRKNTSRKNERAKSWGRKAQVIYSESERGTTRSIQDEENVSKPLASRSTPSRLEITLAFLDSVLLLSSFRARSSTTTSSRQICPSSSLVASQRLQGKT